MDYIVKIGLHHKTIEDFERALGEWMNTPGLSPDGYKAFLETSEPFADDKALTRIASLLWGDKEAFEALPAITPGAIGESSVT